MPPDLSADGHRIDALLRVSIGLTAALAAAFLLALAWVVHRARQRARTAAPEAAAPPAVAVALGVAVLVFAVIDLTLAARSHRAALGPPPPDALRVEVLAQQWAWRFRYAGPDEVFGTADDVTTLNDLRLPVGRAVALEVRSLDVAHGLFLPLLRSRADAYPGRTARTWLRPAREGRTELACSVLCGAAHYQMRAEVTVLSNEQYTHWMNGLSDDQRRRAAAGEAPPPGAWAWGP
ncbi:MAG: cytochrome C oxidase subunit II [Deltaproteobacteria bacterium]|nr:cytochrome C oxidase subunit II [Myxococcales bacterium]MDP3216389.1 cytochrome C oxidase subunit II [Deltaproteobacteria bacterium]